MVRKIFLLLFVLSFTLFSPSQVSKTVNVTAGGLSAALTHAELTTVTNLTVTGTIDARDFITMRDSATALAIINLSEASITAYTGTKGTESLSTSYPANYIPSRAFTNTDHSRRITSISMPSNVTSICDYAFEYCSGLTSITIPSSVTSIRHGAFMGCYGLTSITFPPSVKTIGDFAFCDCWRLTSITIPSSVTSFGHFTFMGATYVASIYESSILPPLISSVFDGIIKTTCILYVPIGSKSAYQKAERWKDFTNIEEMTTALPTALSVIPNTELTIYPNPITDSFQMRGYDGSVLMVIRDLNGRVLLKKQVNANENISINSLPKGIYMVEINTGHGTVIKKIIKD